MDSTSLTTAPRVQGLEIEMSNITISVTNPFSGAYVTRDITHLSQDALDAYAQLMDDELREALHSRLAPCSPAEFLAAWVDEVGPDEAGRVVLGS